MSVSRRREGLGPCAAPFGRPEPQSQLPFLAQRPKAAPGAHGETWAGLWGGRAGPQSGVREGGRCSCGPGVPSRRPGRSVKTVPVPVPFLGPSMGSAVPGETSPPHPRVQAGRGRGFSGRGCPQTAEKPAAGPSGPLARSVVIVV